MELRGKVNCYDPAAVSGTREYKVLMMKPRIFIINLSTGVTPFIHFIEGREYTSRCYNLSGCSMVTVTHAHYRPTKEEFDTLSPDMQDHVMNGGMCIAELTKAKPLPDDPVEAAWEYEVFQQWCLKTYGKRRPVGDRSDPTPKGK